MQRTVSKSFDAAARPIELGRREMLLRKDPPDHPAPKLHRAGRPGPDPAAAPEAVMAIGSVVQPSQGQAPLALNVSCASFLPPRRDEAATARLVRNAWRDSGSTGTPLLQAFHSCEVSLLYGPQPELPRPPPGFPFPPPQAPQLAARQAAPSPAGPRENTSFWQRANFSLHAIFNSAMVLKPLGWLVEKRTGQTAEARLMQTYLDKYLGVRDQAGLYHAYVNLAQERKDALKRTILWSGCATAFTAAALLTSGASVAILAGIGIGFAVVSFVEGLRKMATDPGSLAHVICTPGEEVHKKFEHGLPKAINTDERAQLRDYLGCEATYLFGMLASQAFSRQKKWHHPSSWFNGAHDLPRQEMDASILRRLDDYAHRHGACPIDYRDGCCVIQDGQEVQALRWMQELLGEVRHPASRPLAARLLRSLQTGAVMGGTLARGTASAFQGLVALGQTVQAIPGVSAAVGPFNTALSATEFAKKSITEARFAEQLNGNLLIVHELLVLPRDEGNQHFTLTKVDEIVHRISRPS